MRKAALTRKPNGLFSDASLTPAITRIFYIAESDEGNPRNRAPRARFVLIRLAESLDLLNLPEFEIDRGRATEAGHGDLYP